MSGVSAKRRQQPAYCGAKPYHPIGKCDDCRKLYNSATHVSRAQLEARIAYLERKLDAREPTCRSCKVRVRIPPPVREFNPIVLSASHVRWLENAARFFIAESDQDDEWTAEDFIAWLRPDIIGRSTQAVEESKGGRPIEFDDEKHIRDRERQRAKRQSAA